MKEWEAGINPAYNIESGKPNYYVVRPKGEYPHGLWIADCGRFGDEEARHNCKLIAKAPTMINELLAIHNIIENWYCCGNELFERQAKDVLNQLTRTVSGILCPPTLTR